MISVLQTSGCYRPCWHNIELENIVYLDYSLHHSRHPQREKTHFLSRSPCLSVMWASWHGTREKRGVLLSWCRREDCEVLSVCREVNLMLWTGWKWNKRKWNLGQAEISVPEWKEATERKESLKKINEERQNAVLNLSSLQVQPGLNYCIIIQRIQTEIQQQHVK